MGASAPDDRTRRRSSRFSRVLIRAPSNAVSAALLAILSALLASVVWSPAEGLGGWVERWLVLFLVPGAVAAFVTPPLAALLGGRLSLRRSLLLAVTAAGVELPLLLGWRLLAVGVPEAAAAPVAGVLLFVLGPNLWFREMSLFGLSSPSHARSLPPALLQPVVAVAGVFLLYAPTPPLLVAAGLFLAIAVGSCALLLRAADRPIRREFGVSGVALIRPLLDHINLRDPGAAEALEAFFRRFAKPANLYVSLVAFRAEGRTKATLVLPTVHPGPFAALGASDLPRKLAERLGPDAGLVLVPHTPCNHDLDLPSAAEVDQVARAAAALVPRLEGPQSACASPLLGGAGQPIARAQLLGETALVIVSRAPEPTDDIDYAVADQLRRSLEGPGQPRVVLVDGHNSYVEDEGDITYGTPAAEQLDRDARAAVAAAVANARPGRVEVGVASRSDYSLREHGIGPAGIRCVAVRAAGTTTAYALVDGNNLLLGHRATILGALAGVVDQAEVLTTDNHVVHEVDGSINAVGERYPADALAADIRALVVAAVADLSPVDVYSGGTAVESVPVLGPDWTARLLTSLGDTVSMFANAFLMTFLLLLATSLLVLAALY